MPARSILRMSDIMMRPRTMTRIKKRVQKTDQRTGVQHLLLRIFIVTRRSVGSGGRSRQKATELEG